MNECKDKICLVIGASTRIGKELVVELLDRDATVIATSHSIESLEKNLVSTKQKFPNKLFFKQTDVTDSGNVDDLFQFIEGQSKKLVYCFNFAGICFFKNYLKVLDSEIEKTISTNLVESINTSRAAIKHFLNDGDKKKKYFIQVGSFAGAIPGHKKFSLYAATKEAQAWLLCSLQAEFGDKGTRFVLVTPAGVDIEIYQNTLGDSNALKVKLTDSVLDSANHVAKGILENLDGDLEDYGIRLFPTQLARETYQKFYEQK